VAAEPRGATASAERPRIAEKSRRATSARRRSGPVSSTADGWSTAFRSRSGSTCSRTYPSQSQTYRM